jgi:hypothetical protein
MRPMQAPIATDMGAINSPYSRPMSTMRRYGRIR